MMMRPVTGSSSTRATARPTALEARNARCKSLKVVQREVFIKGRPRWRGQDVRWHESSTIDQKRPHSCRNWQLLHRTRPNRAQCRVQPATLLPEAWLREPCFDSLPSYPPIVNGRHPTHAPGGFIKKEGQSHELTAPDASGPALLGNVQAHQGALPSAGGEGKSSLPVPRRSSRRPERESERRIPARQLQQRGNATAPSRNPAAA
jgi:hypothetical protein